MHPTASLAFAAEVAVVGTWADSLRNAASTGQWANEVDLLLQLGLVSELEMQQSELASIISMIASMRQH